MTSFMLKLVDDKYETVNFIDCKERTFSGVKYIQQNISKYNIDLFECSTGKIVYSGHKDDCKAYMRLHGKQLTEYFKSEEADRLRKACKDAEFFVIAKVYNELYGRR